MLGNTTKSTSIIQHCAKHYSTCFTEYVQLELMRIIACVRACVSVCMCLRVSVCMACVYPSAMYHTHCLPAMYPHPPPNRLSHVPLSVCHVSRTNRRWDGVPGTSRQRVQPVAKGYTRGSTGSQRNWKKSRTDKGRRRRRRRSKRKRFIPRVEFQGGVPAGGCGGQGGREREREFVGLICIRPLPFTCCE